MQRISLHTLGCKLNQAETDELQKNLVKQGFSIVPNSAKADIAIIRGCAVTKNASQTTRELIRHLKRKAGRVIAVGCVENKDLPEIDFAARDNEEVIGYLLKKANYNLLPSPQGDGRARLAEPKRSASARRGVRSRTRALIKIQTGCNFNCAYCVIPSFRGKSKSVSAGEVLNKIRQAEKDGYKEIILTGVNICAYQDGKTDFDDLLATILSNTNIPRVRLGSLDPRLVTNKLIIRSSNSRLMSHWHLSLQSGSNAILKRMKRLYTREQYYNIVQKLRRANSLFSFTTDIIVGFPGETDEEFLESCEFVKKISFAKVHVFPYSPRRGTPAAKMRSQVQDSIKTKRAKVLRELCGKVSSQFAEQFMGLTRPVLFEGRKGKYWYGYTPEYVRVKYKNGKNLRNRICDVKISSEMTCF